MTTPIVAAPDWAAAQASPWAPHNEALRRIESGHSFALIVDRDLTAPPGSCADGALYLVAGSPTGLWSGQAGKLAIAVGANAANGWYFVTVQREGFLLYVQDEDAFIYWDGSAWVDTGIGAPAPTIAPPAPVDVVAGATYDVDAADQGKYLRFTSGSAKTVTVRDEADHALPANGEWHIRNVGSNDLTLVEDTAVTINPPADGTLVVPSGGTVTLKRVAADEFDLIGLTVAA